MKTFISSLILLASMLGTTTVFAQAKPVKEWTVLVYLNGDNDLYQFGFLNIAQMEALGSTDQVNVVVQFDHEKQGVPTQRLYITKNARPVQGKVTSQEVGILGETDMGNPKTFAEFLAWGVQNYPAKKYAVIVWNHGNGWQGVSYDDNPVSHLTMPELRMGLESMNGLIAQQRGMRSRGPQIELLNFDACIMSTLEVAYELRDTAKYLVGSQFNEPGEGENYTAFLTPLVAKPTMAGRELSEVLVYQYSLNYKLHTDINYAAIDLSRVSNFVTQFNAAVGVTNASPSKNAIKNAYGTGSFDLVTGLNNARTAAGADTKATTALDALISLYGYPKEGVERPATNSNRRQEKMVQGFTLTRNALSEVYFRASTNGQWQKQLMQLGAGGKYQVTFAKRPTQYYVVSAATGSRQEKIAVREALTTVVREDANPIVFHNQFPETSPLIADSYSLYTKGAHGMTLWSLAGMMSARNPSTQRFGLDMLSLYKELLFAQKGAPNWTSFFGL